jgi:hypothetical protein
MEENTNADITVDECQELKNIKYKTMLLNGAPLHETKSSNDISNLEKFLEDEKINNSNEPWCKLNKTIKTKKLIEYVEIYKKEKNLDENEAKNLVIFSYIIPKPCSTNPYAIDFGSIKSYPKSFKIDDADTSSYSEASFYISGNF